MLNDGTSARRVAHMDVGDSARRAQRAGLRARRLRATASRRDRQHRRLIAGNHQGMVSSWLGDCLQIWVPDSGAGSAARTYSRCGCSSWLDQFVKQYLANYLANWTEHDLSGFPKWRPGNSLW